MRWAKWSLDVCCPSVVSQQSALSHLVEFHQTSQESSFGFVCFVALRPKSTAMDMAGRSVHLTTFFLGKLEQAVYQYFYIYFSL